jgi:hypothetical protein
MAEKIFWKLINFYDGSNYLAKWKIIQWKKSNPNLSNWIKIPSYRDNDLPSEECIPRLLWNKSDEYYKVLLLKLQIFFYFILFCNFYLNTDPFLLLFLLIFLLLFILFLCFHSPFHTMASSPSSSMDAVQEIWLFCRHSTWISFLWDPRPIPHHRGPSIFV